MTARKADERPTDLSPAQVGWLRWALAVVAGIAVGAGYRAIQTRRATAAGASNPDVAHAPIGEDPAYWTDERMAAAKPLPMPTQDWPT